MRLRVTVDRTEFEQIQRVTVDRTVVGQIQYSHVDTVSVQRGRLGSAFHPICEHLETCGVIAFRVQVGQRSIGWKQSQLVRLSSGCSPVLNGNKIIEIQRGCIVVLAVWVSENDSERRQQRRQLRFQRAERLRRVGRWRRRW